MDNGRLIAIACGLIAMLVIIMLFRSCTENQAGMVKKPQQSEPAINGDISIVTDAPVTEPPELDIFGRPVTTSAEIQQQFSTDTDDITTVPVETDEFGNIVTAVVTAETDESGNTADTEVSIANDEEILITSAFPETTTEVAGETVTEAVEPATLSPIEQYEEDLNNPDSISGFNHGQYDEEGNPLPTLPPGFTIIIN